MSKLRIPVQHYRKITDPGIECVESNFGYVFKGLMLDTDETALVIVDPWSMHYIASYLKRSADIMQTKIAPAIEAARNCGIKVIYAPAPEVAKKYPQWTKFAGEEEMGPPQSPDADWPPLEFRERTGRYTEYFTYHYWYREPIYRSIPWEKNEIFEAIRPEPEDFVIATGNQLHRLLKYFGILHLFYCGFATNMCLHLRDYGMRAFAERGYNLILIKDATTSVENHDTVDELLATKIAIRELEMMYAFSTLTEDFVKACKNTV